MEREPPGRRPLVGRREELAVLRRALVDSVAAHGGVVLVRGEAGIGKSRLVEEVAREVSATHVVLTGRAVEGGGAYRPVADALVGAVRAGLQVTPTSLGPYGAALARLLPDWTEVSGAASESGVDPGLVLGEAVARFLSLVGRGRPCLLVLEDLHWADADSWAVLAHVAVAVPSLPVLVVATMREGEPTAPAADRLTRLPGVVTLRLARLAQEDVHQLAASLGVTDRSTMTMLSERADGLPFMVEELVAVDPGDVPPTLRALVADRFAKLDGDQRRVLAGAAVLGLTPDWSLLHHVTGVSEIEVLAALRAAEEARLLLVDARHLALASLAVPGGSPLAGAAAGAGAAVPTGGRGAALAWTARGRRGCRRPAAAGRCRRRRCRPAAHPGPSRRGAGGLPHRRAARRRPGTDRTAARGSRGRARSVALPTRARTRGPGGGGSGARRCHGW